MARPTETTVFSGRDGSGTAPEIPPAYTVPPRSAAPAGAADSNTPPPLAVVAQRLDDQYRAVKRRVAYFDEQERDWVETGRFVAVVNPAWEGDGLEQYTPAPPTSPADGTAKPADAVWNIPTDTYSIVNPTDVLSPLLGAFDSADDDSDRSPGLGEIFGTVRCYRHGGEIQADVLTNAAVRDPGTGEDRFYLGLDIGFDHFSRTRLYARVIALDVDSGRILRNLSDPQRRKHTGAAAADVANWWGGILTGVEKAGSSLYQTINAAREYRIDFTNLPFDAAGWYRGLEFPTGLADDAAARLPATASPNGPYTAWELYEAAVDALDSTFEGKVNGDAMRNHVGRINRILFSPPSAEKRAVRFHRRRLINQDTLDDDDRDAAAALADYDRSLDDDVDRFKSNQQLLRSLVDGVEVGA